MLIYKAVSWYGFLNPHIEVNHYLLPIDVKELIEITTKEEFKRIINTDIYE